MSKLRRALKTAALVSVCTVSLAYAAPALSQTTAAGDGAATQTAPTAGPVQAAYGNIRPFYGNIRPFYGNIRPFYGNIRPFYGNIRPFWGDNSAFWGSASPFSSEGANFWGSLPPLDQGSLKYSSIAGFWTDAGVRIDDTFTAWRSLDPATATAADYNGVALKLKDLNDRSSAFWGKTVQSKTGKSFQEGFASAMYAKWGVNPNDPASLSKLDPSDQASFFLDWYDGLMNFAGTDHVDHWMKTVNWSPALTQMQGAGGRTTIGLLDFTVVGDATIRKNIVAYDGVSTFSNGHGAAVASLIVGAHDRQGVMGIAPKASVIAYNPFDASGTAGWGDIVNGISMLTSNGASVINMSLGVPGYTLAPDWADVFANPKAIGAKNSIFVIAAGNEGVSQTQNINWNAANPSLIVVGSVDLTGTISNFSNTPGTACLLTAGVCNMGDELKYHYIVAPGELMLVSNDAGGTTRVTGTSIAAPLVSGAIALLHDRWPWLKNFPKQTAQIILLSAKDLGEPGPDPIYGMGLLDVQASQSPLMLSKLNWYAGSTKSGDLVPLSTTPVLEASTKKEQKAWDAKGAYLYGFEPLGETNRDFAVPLSQKLVGQTTTTQAGGAEMFQTYLNTSLDSSTKPTGKFAFGGPTRFSFGGASGDKYTLAVAPRAKTFGFSNESRDVDASLTLKGERTKLTFGTGTDSAPTIAGQKGFVSGADFNPQTSGASPLLGLAAGGAFANVEWSATSRFTVSAGFSDRHDLRDGAYLQGLVGSGADKYAAQAAQARVSYRLTTKIDVTASVTHLDEANALLGVQSLDPTDLSGGAQTDGVNLGVSWQPTAKTTLAATGTEATTRTTNEAQSLTTDRGGVRSRAFAVSLTQQDLLAKGDVLKMSVSRPLTAEGALNLKTVQIVDRSSGQIGVTDQRVELNQRIPVAAEVVYARSAWAGRGDMGFMARAEHNGADAERKNSFMVGGRVRLAF
jgi:hypothetical protein